MYKTFIPLFFLFLANHPDRDIYEKYCNERFSFCIDYPKQFKPHTSPDNGDGLEFDSPDKQTKILAYGRLVIDGLDKLDQEFQTSTEGIVLTYKLKKDSWFVFSGKTKDNKIIYQKTRKVKINYEGTADTYVFQTLSIEYPSDQTSAYADYCTTIAKSLK